MKNIPKEFTEEEIRQQFLEHVKMLIHYWAFEVSPRSTHKRLMGLAHSILATLDGGSDLPAFIVAPAPRINDKQFHIERGENYYPENDDTKVIGDIGGSLHDNLH